MTTDIVIPVWLLLAIMVLCSAIVAAVILERVVKAFGSLDEVRLVRFSDDYDKAE